jgi:RNA polymerase sigma-70 factor (ECF subfamily)
MADPVSELRTRASLLVRLRDHQNHDAWQTFAQVYGPLVYRYARRKGLQEADASDLTQDVLARVAQAIRRFEYDPKRGRFRDWLGTVTGHQLQRFWRRQDRQAALAVGTVGEGEPLDELPGVAPDGEWAAQFHLHLLGAALERVRPAYEERTWQAFEKVWLAGRPAAEVAAELGLTIDHVYVIKSRILKRLEEEVLHLAEDVPHLAP